jgi:hypothetical protein
MNLWSCCGVCVILQANSNLRTAKAHLEMMYENLSNELYYFDYKKELELREIFIEYTTLKFEHYQKVSYCSNYLNFWGPSPIFELPRLDFLQFQHDFRSFSDKKGLLQGAKFL